MRVVPVLMDSSSGYFLRTSEVNYCHQEERSNHKAEAARQPSQPGPGTVEAPENACHGDRVTEQRSDRPDGSSSLGTGEHPQPLPGPETC